MLIGILWVLPHGLIEHGAQVGRTGLLLLVDAIWHLVEQGAAGIVIGLIYGRESAAAESGSSE